MDGCLLVCSLDGWLPGRSPIARAAEAHYIYVIYIISTSPRLPYAREGCGEASPQVIGRFKEGYPSLYRLLDGLQPIWFVAILFAA